AGILAQPEVPVVETVAVAQGERLLAITDGVLEVVPAEDLDRHLLQGLESCPAEVHRRAIQESLTLGIGDRDQHDDASWALWEVPPPPTESRFAELPSGPVPELAELDEGLTLTLRFAPQRHAVRDVLPHVVQLLSSRGAGAQDEHKLSLVLNEALANAVDHGVLRLDSGLKAQGFEAYEALRNLHLSALQEGSVKLTLRLRTLPSGPLREIEVEVEDTGPGFDWRAWEQGRDEAALAPSGRGLLLIRALSTSLSFNEAGNRIRFTLSCG
ncbi:MAG: ATP-binding protein, partial [Acidobacteriota bacterium]|nr:ATP-binding protein [Acidobacteriota bacterium]